MAVPIDVKSEEATKEYVSNKTNHVQTTSNASKHESPGLLELWKHNRFLVFLLPVNFGFELALVGNIIAIPAFLDRFSVTTASGVVEITARDQQVLNAATTVGIFVAAFTAGIIADRFGRRMVVLAGYLLHIAGIFVQGFCSSIMMLFGSRLLSRLGYGLGHALAPVYVAEIVPDNLRAIVCLVYIVQQFVGANFVAGYLPYYFTPAGVNNPVGIAQASYAIQLLSNLVSLFLVDRIGRRPMIVWGTIAITSLLLLTGGLDTLSSNRVALKAVVAFMSLWGFLLQLTLAQSRTRWVEKPRLRGYGRKRICSTLCLTLRLRVWLPNSFPF
ncbi:hypothetical protein EKO04_004004 [Ascochyta lentis]|uniref:Major facilitator superfamily (MFS) profile domain-containing protein n=1 Tax=Ascochyta lentis TaxID=205686 RepID=A0A8H7J4M4_9PLEO|nr:hypothetical protein EKO04_004004 [Ascochyta lentis]